MNDEFYTGNVVKWSNQLHVVADDDGNVVTLIPMNMSNATSHPSKSWPSKKKGRVAIKLVSDTVYGWLVNGMKKNFDIEETLDGNQMLKAHYRERSK